MPTLATHPIIWAPRVEPAEIRRLYQTDAMGIVDERLIDRVGHALVERCRSFIQAVEAVHGRARCFGCGVVIEHPVRREHILTCPSCGWSAPWKDYFATIQNKQLSGAEPVLELFRSFIAEYSGLTDPRRKMLCIDRVIHGFHWYARENVHTRPTAVNLIKGPMMEVIAFLDGLTAGDAGAPEMAARHRQWRQTMEANLARWGQKMPVRAQPKRQRHEGT